MGAISGHKDLLRRDALALAALTFVALWLRAYKLDAVGLSEDESHKFQAAMCYRSGDFTANAEHPMLMKTMITISLIAAEKWNRAIAPSRPGLAVSEEMAIRLPNAVFGALTTVVLFLFASELFDRTIGYLTATLWATGINAIAINRIAKEDTLLVFFAWLGFFFFLKAKREGPVETARRDRLYMLSGASFGLMLASKYFPHYVGLNFLYHRLRSHDPQTNYRIGKRAMAKFFLAFLIAFALANPMLFHPATLRYLGIYLLETNVPHHGYEMMGQLYYNNAWKWTNRTPLYFYPLFLLVKVPPILVLAFIIGLALIVREPSHDGPSLFSLALVLGAFMLWLFGSKHLPEIQGLIPMMYVTAALTGLSLAIGLILVGRGPKRDGPLFLRFMLVFWAIPYSLFGGKYLRYTLSAMPIVYATAAVGISAICRRLTELRFRPPVRTTLAAFALSVFLLAPALAAFQSSPYYSLYVSVLGGGEGRRAYYFPHDEVYDAGMREAVKFICERARIGSLVAQDAPGVVKFYSEKFGRADLLAVKLSSGSIGPRQISPGRPFYVIEQKGRRYFENQAWLDYIKSRYRPVKEVWVCGVCTTRVYEIKCGDILKFASKATGSKSPNN